MFSPTITDWALGRLIGRGASVPRFDELRRITDELREQLGPFGFQWLCACAVYPGIRFPLTCYLGSELARALVRPLPSETEHLALFRLTWFRKGWMPDDIRLSLIAELSPASSKTVRAGIGTFLDAVQKQPLSIASREGELDLARSSTAPLGLFRFRQKLRPGRPLRHDVIFAEFMMGGTPQPGSIILDRRYANLIGTRLGGWITAGTIVAAIILASVAIFGPATTETYVHPFFHLARLNQRNERIVVVFGSNGWFRDDNLVVLSSRGELETFDNKTVRETSRVNLAGTGSGVAMPSASPSRERQLLVTVSGTVASLWDTNSGKPIGKPLSHPAAVSGASFDPSGKLVVTASADNKARIWDARTGEPSGKVLAHLARIYAATFDPTGTRILTASADKTVRIWDARTGDPVGPPLRHEGPVIAASFDPAGRVVTASGNTIRFWESR
jgi:WD domain, G-beta repeat